MDKFFSTTFYSIYFTLEKSSQQDNFIEVIDIMSNENYYK